MIKYSLFCISLGFVLVSCSREKQYGDITLSLTDSPVYSQTVEGIYITIKDIIVDGQPLEALGERKTFDLLELTNGNLAELGTMQTLAKEHTNIQIILDNQMDESGASPGCYVLENQQKKPLSQDAELDVTITGLFNVIADANMDLIVDFDARRSMTSTFDGQDWNYAFVDKAAFNQAIRIVPRWESGNIVGNCAIPTNYQQHKIGVYAYYANGSTNIGLEAKENAYGVTFSNAANASWVNDDGFFYLALYENGLIMSCILHCMRKM